MERVHAQMMFKRHVPQTVARHIIGFIPPRTKTWCEWFVTVYAYILAQHPIGERLVIDFDRFSVVITRRGRERTTLIITVDDQEQSRHDFVNPRPGHNDYRVLSLLYNLCTAFPMWSYGDQCVEMIFLRRHPHVSANIERHPLRRHLLVRGDYANLIRRLSRLEPTITNPIIIPDHQITLNGFLETFPEHTRHELQQDAWDNA